MIAQAIRILTIDIEQDLAAVSLLSLFGLTVSFTLVHAIDLTLVM